MPVLIQNTFSTIISYKQYLSAQEKLERNIALSPSDMHELMRDPKSPLAKLYNEMPIDRWVFMECMREWSYETSVTKEKELSESQKAEEREEYRKEINIIMKESNASVEAGSAEPDLKKELDALLELSPTADAETAARHNYALTAHYYKLILARMAEKFGKELMATFQLSPGQALQHIRLSIPEALPFPLISIDKIIERNRVLSDYFSSSGCLDSDKKNVAAVAANAQMGFFSVIKIFREFLSKNQEAFAQLNIDIDDVTIPMLRSFFKEIDSMVHECAKENKPLLDRMLENNQVLMKKFSDALKANPNAEKKETLKSEASTHLNEEPNGPSERPSFKK